MATPSGTFQRPDLGTAFNQFPFYSAMGFVALDVLPILPVSFQSANYAVIKAEAMLTLQDLKRGPGGGYKRSDYTFIQDSYATVEYGLEELIDDRQRKLYINSFDAERYAVDRLMLRLMTNLEVLTAAAVQGSLGGTAAISVPWSSASSAAPVTDVRAAKIALRALNGFNPANAVLIMDWEVLEYLKDNAQILERVKYSGRNDTDHGKITADAIAEALGVRKLIVAGMMKNTADAGQNKSLSAIWDRTKVTLAHLSPSGDIQLPGLGHTFSWSEDGASPEGTFEEYREEQNRSQVIRCRAEFQSKVKYSNAGYVLTSVLA